MSKEIHKKDNNQHILLSKMRQDSVERKWDFNKLGSILDKLKRS